MLTLANRLKEVRLDSGLKQTEVESLSRFKQKDISRYESGAATFIPNEYIHFWYTRGYNLNYLFSGQGPKRLDQMLIDVAQMQVNEPPSIYRGENISQLKERIRDLESQNKALLAAIREFGAGREGFNSNVG